MNKIVYRATSNFDFFYSLLWRAACLLGIMYLTFHYEENPPVILGVGSILFLIFVVAGNDEITVYSDKVVQIDTSILNLFMKSKGRVYEIKDIESASLPNKALPNIVEAGIIVTLMAILPKKSPRNNQRRFYLDLKNGKSITILTHIAAKTPIFIKFRMYLEG